MRTLTEKIPLCFKWRIIQQLTLWGVVALVSGCAPTAEVQFVKDKNYTQNPQRILAIEDMGLARDNAVVTDPFNQKLSDEFMNCGVIFQVYSIVKTPTTMNEKKNIQDDVMQAVYRFKPDALIEIQAVSYKTRSGVGYGFSYTPNEFSFKLKDAGGKNVWEAHVKPHFFISDTSGPYTIMATRVVSEMRSSGILNACK